MVNKILNMDAQIRSDFYWSDQKEPHISRRKEILKKYPEITKLYGVNPRMKYSSTFWVIVQIAIALNIYRVFDYFENPFYAWGIFLLITYFIGATIEHALFLAVHEITHYMAFKKKWPNNILAFVANIPIVFPYAMSFKYYHALHHWEQGKEGSDADIPLPGEAKLFKGFFGKSLWYSTQIFFYAFRPMFVKKIPIDKWLIYNILFQITAMAIILPLAGWYGTFYLLLTLFLAGGLHPTSGHFISEHYVFDKDQETYSYYGPLNLVTYNVGYHNEHHDFPYIPGSRLRQVREIAPEFYNSLHYYTSWPGVTWKFLTDKSITLYSRMKRKN